MTDRAPQPTAPRRRTRSALLLAVLVGVSGGVAAVAPAGSPALAGPDRKDPVVYEVSDVDGKLLHLLDGTDERLDTGDRLAGGAELRTGWFSAADLRVPRDAARFHLESRTHVRLGVDTPGVLLVLEKGRLRAIFDAIQELAGEEASPRERRIETPSAVLAVRGTEYGVAVGRGGATILVVFEGVVEVTPLAGPAGVAVPVRVPAGQALRVRLGVAPSTPFAHGLTRHGWDRGAMPAMGPPTGAGEGRTTVPGEPGAGPGEGPPEGVHPGAQGPPSEPPGSQGQQGPPPGTSAAGGGTAPPAQGAAAPPDAGPGTSAGAPGGTPSTPPGPSPAEPPQGPPPSAPRGPSTSPSGPPPGSTDQDC